MVGSQRLKLMYVTQIGSAPPRLAFFANFERDIPAHYIRFLENRFRNALILVGSPLRFQFRKTGRTPERPPRSKPEGRNVAGKSTPSALLKGLGRRRSYPGARLRYMLSSLHRDPDSRFRQPVHPVDRATGARGARLLRDPSVTILRSRKFARCIRAASSCRAAPPASTTERARYRSRGAQDRRAGARHLLRHVCDRAASGRASAGPHAREYGPATLHNRRT